MADQISSHSELRELRDLVIRLDTKMDTQIQSLQNLQADHKETSQKATLALQKATANEKTLQKYDRNFMAIWVAIVGGVVKVIFDWIKGV